MKFILAALFVLVAAAAPAQAICEVSCEISQAAPFTAYTEADTTVSHYALFVNGAQSPLAPRVVSGVVDFTFVNGLTRGMYSFVIVAYDANGEVWRTDPNTLTVKPGKRTVKFR